VGGDEDKRKVAWDSWDDICKTKECGRLGVKNVFLYNEALLAKWRWEFFQEKGLLWSEGLKSKYGGWRGLYERNVLHLHLYGGGT